MDRLLQSSATRLAHLIRTREVTSAEVVEVHIAQVERVNPSLNAVVVDRFWHAREEAREADRRVREAAPDALPPLHGVPCTIKESFALTGMPNTSGLVARKGRFAFGDATAVARLRAAGAIPLGVTNVSELCMWMESSNRVYGRTRNAYDPRRTSGGSSGGEGAIVGAGGSPFGLGSDIGGSIRMPAFFNGVFGHKPTGGLVPNTGQFPLAAKGASRYLVTGPIARRAEDLMPLLRILAGPDGQDPGCEPMPLGDPDAVRIDGLRVVQVEDNGYLEVSGDLRDAQHRCADALRGLGARVEKRQFAGLRDSLAIWSSALSDAGGPSFAALLGQGVPINPARELVRFAVGRSPHTLPALGLAGIEGFVALAASRRRRFVEAGQRLRAELLEAIGSDGVMLFPPYPRPAPRHLAPLLPPFSWAYTAILNVLEMPATQVPLGLNGEGLPLGVQVAAAHGNDHLTIAVALALERAFGGWTPPPLAG